MTIRNADDSAWDRLETTLLEITPDQTVTIESIVDETGLSPETVRTVLDGLVKANLFDRRDERAYVRRSLFDKTAGPFRSQRASA